MPELEGKGGGDLSCGARQTIQEEFESELVLAKYANVRTLTSR